MNYFFLFKEFYLKCFTLREMMSISETKHFHSYFFKHTRNDIFTHHGYQGTRFLKYQPFPNL